MVTGAALVLLATFYGLMCAVLPLQLLTFPMVPILLMVALTLWMLPDIGGVYDTTMENLMVWFVGFNILWPSYVALNAPGLPWITPTRVVVFSLLALVVFNLATSGEFRTRITDSMSATPLIRKLFWGFWLITSVSIVFSGSPFFSISKYANNQIFWTMMFCISAFLATREGYVMRLGRLMCWTAIVVGLLGIYEFHIKIPFWLNHLPSFLKADAELLANLGVSAARAGTDKYRVRGTMPTSLYFAEYLGLALPFILHFMTRTKDIFKQALLGAGALAVACSMFFTDARTGMIALLLSMLIYAFIAAWRTLLQHRHSLMAATVVFAYPIVFALVAALVVFWPRLHVLVIGGGQHVGSTDARIEQWKMGLPKLMTGPLGHGVGRANEVLGYTNPAGESSIDSYYLSLLLDYGVLGLAVFLALFAVTIWIGLRLYRRAQTEEEQLIAPLTIGLINFIIVKAVMSTEINLPVAFIMIGAVVGLAWRQHQRDAVAGAAGGRLVAAPPAAAPKRPRAAWVGATRTGLPAR